MITYNVRDYLLRERRILVIRYTTVNNSLQTPAKNTRKFEAFIFNFYICFLNKNVGKENILIK
jgi:hypothetical protein